MSGMNWMCAKLRKPAMHLKHDFILRQVQRSRIGIRSSADEAILASSMPCARSDRENTAHRMQNLTFAGPYLTLAQV